MSNTQPDSLVKYDTPILVSTSVTGKKSQKKKQNQLAPLDKSATTRNEDYLNSILPPREYTHEGQLWVRYVSPTPAPRAEVINLQEMLDQRLQSK
jgi:dynein light intermediate chain